MPMNEHSAYETKVILKAVAEIICKAETMEEVYESVRSIANVEGLILKPYTEARKNAKKH